jgi:glycosyltransferase involved in cell wall biosynthesis
MKTKPAVSVVIPTYNRAKELKRALNSVQAQTFSNWEVLVVDNNSEDNTNEIVASFNDSRIKLFKIHNHGVIAASRNMGIKEAQGVHIAFLDSDDWWMPEKLRLSLDSLNRGADIVYHDLFIITKYFQRFFWKKIHSRHLKRPVFEDLLANANTLANSSVVVRKKFLTQINGISEASELIGCEDFDTWLRIAQHTENFQYIPFVLGFYWAGGGNVSSPQRTLENIDAIECKFSKQLNKLYQDNSVWWLNYARARANYLIGSYDSAEPYLKAIRFSKSPFLIYLKGRWMFLITKLRLK